MTGLTADKPHYKWIDSKDRTSRMMVSELFGNQALALIVCCAPEDDDDEPQWRYKFEMYDSVKEAQDAAEDDIGVIT